MVKLSILRDKAKNMESTLWKMKEQLDVLEQQGKQIFDGMKQIRVNLQKTREELFKAERLQKADKVEVKK